MLQHEIVNNILDVFSLLFVLRVDGATKGDVKVRHLLN
jgi:hypothetical protein